MDRGSLSVRFVFFFFFVLNKWPGHLPRKILGDKLQMNTEAEYDMSASGIHALPRGSFTRN